MDTNQQTVSSVTLMILGEELEPSTVSDLVKLEPSQSWKRGEEKKFAKSTFYEWGGWKRFLEETDDSVEEKIASWIGILEGKAEAFKAIKNYGWKASLDAFIAFNEASTISISNDLSRKIGELNLDIDFSLQAENRGANKATHTTSANARLFDNEPIEINDPRHGGQV